MIDRHFFDNPSFLEYVRLLRDLHIAIREGWDETTEGEALRERMDDPGRWLSSGEIASLNGISADFYSLTDPHPVEVSPITAEVMTDLEEVLQARRSRDFSKALVLLRKHAGRIPPARLAYLRGSVWMEAGEYSIASAFLQRASARAGQSQLLLSGPANPLEGGPFHRGRTRSSHPIGSGGVYSPVWSSRPPISSLISHEHCLRKNNASRRKPSSRSASGSKLRVKPKHTARCWAQDPASSMPAMDRWPDGSWPWR